MRSSDADTASTQRPAPPSPPVRAADSIARSPREPEAREAISAIGIAIVPLTATIAERAAAARVKPPRLRPPDAIVLPCAEELDGELLSYDERLAQASRTRERKRDQ